MVVVCSTVMPRSLTLGSLLAVLASVVGCDAAPQSECHRRAVERFGCCPACDEECRAAVSQECAAVHDEPLPRPDVDMDASSSASSSDGADDSSAPAPE